MENDPGCTGAAPLSPTAQRRAHVAAAVGGGAAHLATNFTIDDLSSLSTVISRELFEDRSLGSIEEGLLLRKLERQNKRKFQSGKFKLNIALIGEEGAGKSQIREKMMEQWTLMSERRLEGFGIEYFYQISDNCDFLQVTILETKPSGKLVSHCESRIEEYIQKVRHAPPGLFGTGGKRQSDGEHDDTRLHLCMWVFPANAGYWRLPASALAGVASDLNVAGLASDLSARQPGAAAAISRRRESKGGESCASGGGDERFLRSGSSLEDISEAVNLLNREHAGGADIGGITSHMHSGSGSAAYGHAKKVQEGASLLYSNGRDIYSLQQELLRSRSNNNFRAEGGGKERSRDTSGGSLSAKSASKTSASDQEHATSALQIAAMSSPRLGGSKEYPGGAGANTAASASAATYAPSAAASTGNVTIGTFSDLHVSGLLSSAAAGGAAALQRAPVVAPVGGFLHAGGRGALGTNIYLPQPEESVQALPPRGAAGEESLGSPVSPRSGAVQLRDDEESGVGAAGADGEAGDNDGEQHGLDQQQPRSNKDSIFFLSHRMDEEEIELNISDMTASSQDVSPLSNTGDASKSSTSGPTHEGPSGVHTGASNVVQSEGFGAESEETPRPHQHHQRHHQHHHAPPRNPPADPREDELLRSPELSLPLMRHLTKLVQLVPVISKIDTVPPADVAGLREELRQMLRLGEIQLFTGLMGEETATNTIAEEGEEEAAGVGGANIPAAGGIAAEDYGGKLRAELGRVIASGGGRAEIVSAENIITEANLHALETRAVVCRECEEAGGVDANMEIAAGFSPGAPPLAGGDNFVHGSTGGRCVVCGRTQIPLPSLGAHAGGGAAAAANEGGPPDACIEELPARAGGGACLVERGAGGGAAERPEPPGGAASVPHSPAEDEQNDDATPPLSPIIVHPERAKFGKSTPLVRGPDVAPFRLVHADASDSARGSDRGGGGRHSPFYEPLHSGIIRQLRGQVLACPLMVDCNLGFEAQDLRYNLPRFDGLPPTSPDFLRMVLIEGCSLLIIDKASGLFTRYYERRERMLRRRERFETAHQFIMSGLMFAAASAAFFLHRK